MENGVGLGDESISLNRGRYSGHRIDVLHIFGILLSTLEVVDEVVVVLCFYQIKAHEDLAAVDGAWIEVDFEHIGCS